MDLPTEHLYEAERAVQSHATLMMYLVVMTLTKQTNTWQPLSAGTKNLKASVPTD